MREFRFGVIAESVRDGAQLLETARRAEELGYSTLLLRDHFVTEPFGDQLSPMLGLTAVAAATTSLRVGTLVLANDYRHPVLLAKEAATLQHLSGGRFELGIGAGWLLDEYERAGIPFDSAGERVTRLDESLRLLGAFFRGQKHTVDGVHYQVRDLGIYPVPEPRPPILVGAGGRRMLRLAGREADIVGILPIALPTGSISDALAERSPETMARKVEWVREGGRFDQVEVSQISTFDLTSDRHAAAARVAAGRGWDTEDVLAMPSKFIGTLTEITSDLQHRRDRFGLSYHVVSDREMTAVAPLVTQLTGT